MAVADNGGSTQGWLERILNTFASEPQDQKQLLDLLKILQSRELIGADELKQIQGQRSNQIAKTLGRPAYAEVVHRDNLVVRG